MVSIHQVQHRLHRRPGGALEEALAQVRERVAAGGGVVFCASQWCGLEWLSLGGRVQRTARKRQHRGSGSGGKLSALHALHPLTHPCITKKPSPVHDEHLVDVALPDVAVQELHKVRHHLGHGRGAGKAALQNRRRQRHKRVW